MTSAGTETKTDLRRRAVAAEQTIARLAALLRAKHEQGATVISIGVVAAMIKRPGA